MDSACFTRTIHAVLNFCMIIKNFKRCMVNKYQNVLNILNLSLFPVRHSANFLLLYKYSKLWLNVWPWEKKEKIIYVSCMIVYRCNSNYNSSIFIFSSYKAQNVLHNRNYPTILKTVEQSEMCIKSTALQPKPTS